MIASIFGGNGPIPSDGLIPKGPLLGLDRPHDRARFGPGQG